MKMIDVGGKDHTARVAVASARVRMLPATLARITEGRVEKGDVLAAAQIAGVMAAKKTPDLLPLCHPIALSGVSMEIRTVGSGAQTALEIRATVKTTDRTGVEMEALTAASAAALTVYDMLKSVDRGMVIEAVQLEHKSGGRSGTWDRTPEHSASGDRIAPQRATGSGRTAPSRAAAPVRHAPARKRPRSRS